MTSVVAEADITTQTVCAINGRFLVKFSSRRILEKLYITFRTASIMTMEIM